MIDWRNCRCQIDYDEEPVYSPDCPEHELEWERSCPHGLSSAHTIIRPVGNGTLIIECQGPEKET